jgi:GNAT superfamily N-acetyltransferase
MTDHHMRDSRDADQAAIQQVTIAAYQEYGPIMGDLWDLYRRSILATLADFRPAEQIVAEQDGELVGTVLLYPARVPLTGPNGSAITLDWPEIRLLAVAPAARGRGVGRALVDECLRRARQAGAAAITLHTTDMMAVAQSMYVRMGFTRAPELDFKPAPGVTIKGYRLPLDAQTAD